MTLVLEGTPSSGGPRCLRSRGSRGSRGVVASFLSVPFVIVRPAFVVSVGGATSLGTFVGVVSTTGTASVVSTCSGASVPSAYVRSMVSLCNRLTSKMGLYLQHDLHVQCVHHGHGHDRDHEWRCGDGSRSCCPRRRYQCPQREPRGCGRAGWRPCGRGWPCR